jgi:hypothetical protein
MKSCTCGKRARYVVDVGLRLLAEISRFSESPKDEMP